MNPRRDYKTEVPEAQWRMAHDSIFQTVVFGSPASEWSKHVKTPTTYSRPSALDFQEVDCRD